MASLRLLVKSPVARDLYTISNILWVKISVCAFRMVIGIASDSQLLGSAALISFRMSSSVVAVKSMKQSVVSYSFSSYPVLICEGSAGVNAFMIFFILVVKVTELIGQGNQVLSWW